MTEYLGSIISAIKAAYNTLSPGEALVFFSVLGLACLLIAVYAIKNINRLWFYIRLKIKNMFTGGMRFSIMSFLHDRGFLLTVKDDRGRNLGTARVVAVDENAITLRVSEDRGFSSLSKGARVACQYRPVWFFYIRSNSFDTYCLSVRKKKDQVEKICVQMPVGTEEVKRRRYKRKKIRRQRAMIVRVWLRNPMKGGEGRFMYSKPAMEINVNYHISKMDQERVFDVSQRGIRVGLHRKLLGNITPKPGESVCLEVKPFVKSTGKFDSFIFGGIIRHVYTTPGDMVVVGVEFTLCGKRHMRVGEVVYKWQDINKAEEAKSFLWTIKQL